MNPSLAHAAEATAGVAVAAALTMAAAAICQTGYLALSSAPLVALGLGIAFRTAANSDEPSLRSGLAFTQKHALRAAVVLLGLQLSTAKVFDAGWETLFVDLFMVASTLGVAWLAARALGIGGELATLVGVGAAICGQSAVAATQAALAAKPENTTIAIGTVVAAGLVSVAMYPALFALSEQLGFQDAAMFGRFIGSTVHEVSQVVAIGTSLGADVAQAAVAAKMGRVALLLPVLFVVVALLHATSQHDKAATTPLGKPSLLAALALPVAFSAAILVNHLAPQPHEVRASLGTAALVFSAAAMAAVGASTNLATLSRAGHKPMLLAAILAAWLVIGGALVNTSLWLLIPRR